MKTASQGRSGFTLIEMLLAAAAGALILAVLVNVYGRAIKLRNTSAEHTKASRLEARAIAIIRNDLRNARLSGGVMAVTLETDTETNHSRFPGDLRFDTTTGVINEDTFTPELQEIEYSVAEDPTSPDGKTGALKRSINRNLLATIQEVEKEETLLTGVESMEVGFYDGTDWQSSWTVTEDDVQVPQAVRLRITRADDAHPGSSRKMIEILVPWTTQVPVPTSTATDDDGAGTGTGGLDL